MTRINTNVDALMATANLNKISFQLSKTLSHLSTGLRIVSAADDPSGVGLMSTFQAQMRGTTVAIQNAEDGLSMLQVADSALTDTMDIVLRMRDVCLKANNPAVYTTAQITTMDTELTNLRAELDRRFGAITFNTKVLFSGGLSGAVIQVGADNIAALQLSITIPQMSQTNINGQTLSAINTLSFAAAAAGIDLAQSGINQLGTVQAIIGSQARELERIINALNSQEVNVAAAASRISDADMASEISEFAKQQVISMAATAMIAQANAQPQQIMKLLGIG